LSTKENIDYIKQELSNEEKLLESVIKAEKFYKKNKKWILAITAAAVLFGIGSVLYDMKKEQDLIKSNQAYAKLLQNPSDTQAANELKQLNPRLYSLYLYQMAIKKKDIETLKQLASSKDPVLSDLASYHLAVITQDRKKIDDYVVSGTMLKDYALLDDAYLHFKSGDIQGARSKLSLVGENSAAKPFAILLRHYGVAK